MEVAHKHKLGLLLSLYPSFLQHPSRPQRQRLSRKSWFDNRRFVKKQIRNLAGRWSFHVNEMLKIGDVSREALVHEVKQGETLSSISKQYGVPVYAVAALNGDIVDLDLVYQGQRLRIPAPRSRTQRTDICDLFSFNLKRQQLRKRTLNIIDGLPLLRHNFTVLIPRKLPPHARASGYILVLVPLIAFCIRCIIDIVRTKIAGSSSRHQLDAQIPEQHLRSSHRSMRWKSALLEPEDRGITDSESVRDTNSSAEDDRSERFIEESPGGYRKLEMDYQKFLSECGITDCGYWRGGSPG